MKFFVSPHGLVSCPDCKTHFKPDGDPWNADWRRSAACPHCGTRLGQISGRSVLSRIRSTGRAGLVAAALFGLTATGCSGSQEKKPEPPPGEADVSDDPDAKKAPDVEAPPELLPEPAYGIPAEPMHGEPPDPE